MDFLTIFVGFLLYGILLMLLIFFLGSILGELQGLRQEAHSQTRLLSCILELNKIAFDLPQKKIKKSKRGD